MGKDQSLCLQLEMVAEIMTTVLTMGTLIVYSPLLCLGSVEMAPFLDTLRGVQR